jgi:hypothetical protein
VGVGNRDILRNKKEAKSVSVWTRWEGGAHQGEQDVIVCKHRGEILGGENVLEAPLGKSVDESLQVIWARSVLRSRFFILVLWFGRWDVRQGGHLYRMLGNFQMMSFPRSSLCDYPCLHDKFGWQQEE